MPIKYNDTKQLARDIDRISRSVMNRAVADAIALFPTNTLVDVMQLGEDEKMFEYTPKQREYIFGANGVQPATCTSVPPNVETAGSEPVRGFTHLFEHGYDICIEECNPASLDEEVYKKEFAVATALLHMVYQQMWYGMPELMQYGLVNHPLIQVIQSPPTMTPGGADCSGTNKCGSTRWADKSNNEIMKELRSAMRNYLNPQVAMSEYAYENSLGMMDEATVGQGQCGLIRQNCIENSLRLQNTVNFNGNIMFFPELDQHPDFDNSDIAIVYDRGAMELLASPIMWKGSHADLKVVKVFRTIRTGGLRVNYEDSIKIIKGI